MRGILVTLTGIMRADKERVKVLFTSKVGDQYVGDGFFYVPTRHARGLNVGQEYWLTLGLLAAESAAYPSGDGNTITAGQREWQVG